MNASSGNTLSVVNNVVSSLGKGGLLGVLGGVTVAAAGLAVGLGVTATKAAGDFRQAMDQNVAHAGLAANQVDNVTQSILKMAPALGQMPTNMATALYPVLSSFSGMTDQAAKAQLSMLVLSNASKSVAGSSADLSKVTKAATSVWNAYGLATGNAARDTTIMNNVFDQMNTTVNAGNMQWSDYSEVIGKLSVASQAAGVSFNQTNAALATLTNSGYSAQLAGTYLGNTFNDLYIKADNIAKQAKGLGISFDETKYKGLDLAGKIQYLSNVTDGNQASLLKLLGGNSVALKTFDALSNSINQYKSNLTALGNAQGATQQSFDKVSKGFNFSMQKLQAAGQVLLITIGTALLPYVSQLLNKVTPLISGFAAWETRTHGVENALSMTGVAINKVAMVIGILITGIQSVIVFFQKNQIAADLLLSVLGMIALQIASLLIPAFIGMGIAVFTTIIPAFAAWAIGAAAAGIATLIAFWPIIAAAVIVTAVIFVVILTIQHWGQIAAWLKGAWAAFTSWFMVTWNTVATWFKGVMTSIGNGFHAAWDFIVNVAKTALMVLFLLIFGEFIAIGALFIWLYNHNYYFKVLVDAIVNFFKAGFAWLTNAWNSFTSWLGNLWEGTSHKASEIWGNISKTVGDRSQDAGNWLQQNWSKASNWFHENLIKLGTWAINAWQMVSAVFSAIWAVYIGPPLSRFWNQITGWFGNLVNWAYQSGRNFINMLVQGIESGSGAVWNAVTGIASQIWKALGFHSPAKAGPGADADKWMPNLIKMLSQGLKSGVPQMQQAVYQIASPLATLGGGSTITQGAGRSVVIGGGGHTFIINVSTMARSQSEVSRMVDMMEEEISKRFRLQTSGYASGGIY